MDKKAQQQQQSNMLAFQNGKLKAQLEVKRDEVADLNRKYQQLVDTQTNYENTLLVTDRLWSQVDSDIHTLGERVLGVVAEKALPDHCMHKTDAVSKSGQPDIPDPFLLRLLQGEPALANATQQSYKSLLADASVLELALRRRLSTTLDLFAKVLDQIRAGQQQRLDQTDQQQHKVQSDATSNPFAHEVTALQKTVDGQQAYIRTLEASLAQTDDEFVKHKEQIRDMNNQLADLDEQLAKARKLQRSANANGQHPDAAAIHATLTNGTSAPVKAETAEQALPQAAYMLTKSAEEAEQMLSKRDLELEHEREVNINLQKDIRDLKAQLSSNTASSQQQLYQQLLQDRDAVRAERNELLSDISRLEAEGSKLVALQQQKTTAERNAKQAQEMQEVLSKQLLELQGKVSQMREQHEQLEQELQAVRAEYGQQETLVQCTQHLSSLQRDLKLERLRVKQLRGKDEEVVAAKQEVVEANKNLQTKDKQAQRLQLKLQKQQTAIDAIKQLKERSDDLQVFVEVLQSLTPEPEDLLHLRASEASLREKVGRLEASLQGHHLQQSINTLQEAERSALERVEAVVGEKDLLQVETQGLQAELANHKQQLTDLQAENSTFLEEIDSTSRIYEQTQGENSSLVRRMVEGEARLNQMNHAQLKHQQSLHACQADLQAAQQASGHSSQLQQTLQRQVHQLQAALQECSRNEEELRLQIHAGNASIAQLKRDKEDLGSSLKQQALQLAGVESDAADRKRSLDTEYEKASREKHKRQRIEEDNKALQTKVEKLQQHQGKGSLSKQTEEELEGLRALLRCNVCHERQKDVIITKCMHMFCRPCIQRNLDSRSRKCPGCGAAFGTKDVHQFYFT